MALSKRTVTSRKDSRRSRRWVFTLNNPSDGDSSPDQWEHWAYLVWQKERGEAGTVHLQGLVCWGKPATLQFCKTQSPRAHWEIMRGTLEQAIKYCTKKETRVDGPWIRGHKPQPGQRSDLVDVADAIDEGMSLREIALAHPSTYMKYHGGIKSYRLETANSDRGKPTIIIYWGPSGCGKSKLVHERYPHAYRKPKGKWWDGYHTQKVVIFDDFYSWVSYDELLRILDWYPLQVEIKQSYVSLVATTFIFTSNQDPMDWYRHAGSKFRERDTDFDRSALWRRIKQFGYVWHWGDCYRDNAVNTLSHYKDWVEDTRFQRMDL